MAFVRVSCHGLCALSRGALVVLIALAALAASGCGGLDQLPPPGTDSLVVVHSWERPGDMPARIEAQRISQKDGSFHGLDLEQVLMRLPKEDGVVYLAAPLAVYSADAANAIVLTGRPGDDGPVRFNGIWRGRLFAGRAAGAIFNQRTRVTHFSDVEILCEGLCQWTAEAEMHEKDQQIIYGKTNRRPEVPAMAAALAALPPGLELSER